MLGTALGLFNARGIGRVTTAEIASAAGMNEGNLYYYFKRKEQLAEALFGLFEAAALAAADHSLADPNALESYAAYQHGWFALMWEFRFLYRDGVAFRAMAPGLLPRLRDLNARGQKAVRAIFVTMIAHGLLHATAADLDVLIANIWIVSAYWMDYRLMQDDAEISHADLAWGFRQVEMLYRPYLATHAVEGAHDPADDSRHPRA